MVTGVDPEREKVLSRLFSALTAGTYLSSDSGNCLYAGVELAKKLEAKVGDEVSFIGSASDDSFVADLFRLCGLFRTGSFSFDSTASFVTRSYFDTLMYADDKASYVAVKLEEIEQVDKVKARIDGWLPEALESVSWKVLMHSMVQAMEVDSFFGYISIGLFFVVIFFVIMIFGFINVSSRIREFGTLRCIGLSKARVSLLLLYEIFILSTMAIVLAAPIGGYIAYYFSVHPMVIAGISETYKAYGVVSDEIPLSFDLVTIGWNIAVVYGLNFLSVIYPIVYINRFEPIEAVHHV